MPDHERAGGNAGDTTRRGGDAACSPAIDIAAVLEGLDRATREFTRRLDEAQRLTHAATAAPQVPPAFAGADPQSGGFIASATAAPETPEQPLAGDAAFEDEMSRAEAEAREYLERAKARADSLVSTMVVAVEREASGIRREAEDGIRRRWLQVESEADRYMHEARRIGERIVDERQTQIGKLSDGIFGRAQALTRGMEDADAVRDQFDTFVQALSSTADRIAAESAPGAAVSDLRPRLRGGPSARAERATDSSTAWAAA